ncbi:hypothetical protein DE146DRAFT_728783 [Phaeosphaeria sp. MPI-PUGE-AT-0046c]|nr:hypothetical protein DE146DRAFT_728783 [Phaeosphaeria sp. MPI-PUGE-AT-0046c]
MKLDQLISQIELAYSHGKLDQTQLLAHSLRLRIPPFASTDAEEILRRPVIVGIDAEWFEYDKSRITELGLSVLHTDTVWHLDSPWDIVRKMLHFHVRIMENAHLVNSELCPGHPEKFQFGQTTFAKQSEVKALLEYAFSQTDKRGQRLPVIFVGHAVDNDIQVIKEHFGFDIDAQGVLVATIDTQEMAREVRFVNPPAKMRLSHLMSKFCIVENYLHNAGNDVVCTMIAAVLMACSDPFPDNHAKSYADFKQHVLVQGSQTIAGQPVMSLGSRVFCTNCHSSSHFVKHCNAQLWCSFSQGQAGGGIILRPHGDFSCIKLAKWQAEQNTKMAQDAGTQSSLLSPSVSAAITASTSTTQPMSIGTTIVPQLAPNSTHSHETAPVTIPSYLQLSMPRYPFPCALCIESLDPMQHKPQHAYSHLEKDCIYRPMGSAQGTARNQ